MSTTHQAGTLLRQWRRRRNVSQLELAHGAGVSARHVSFIETGRSRPTSEMIIRLSERLDVPLREQNRLLLAGGFAPAHPEHGLDALPMAAVNRAIDAILTGHQPFPALVIDRGWDLVAANEALYTALGTIAEHLLEPPVNVIRLTLDPEGLAPRIVNLDEWRESLRIRLEHEYAASGDERLRDLVELASDGPAAASPDAGGLVVPLRLRAADGTELSFISTTTVFGTPREVTLSELAIEAFYPTDDATRAALGGSTPMV